MIIHGIEGKLIDYATKLNFHKLRGSRIMDSEHILCSPIFVVQYCEEIVPFNIVAQFRTEIDMIDLNESTELFIEVDLLCASFCNKTTAENAVKHYQEAVLPYINLETYYV